MHRGAEAQLDTSARDRFMADSLLALLERESEQCVVLLAHNGHVQKQPVVWGDCTTHACNLRVRQASIGPRSARNTLLGFEHAPQAQAEPGEMRRQQGCVA
jgi:erythromycin esterase-like protein